MDTMFAQIKDCKIDVYNKNNFQLWLTKNNNKKIKIEIVKPTRSLSQCRLYWKYLEVIEIETGDNANDLHEYFKRKYLKPVFKIIRGQEIKLPNSTVKLSKLDFSEYLERICAETGITIPSFEI